MRNGEGLQRKSSHNNIVIERLQSVKLSENGSIIFDGIILLAWSIEHCQSMGKMIITVLGGTK